jgi:hypothetical protein
MRRRRTAKEKELEDNSRLLRAWKKFHAEERAAVLVGPHGAVLSELLRMFKNLQHCQPSQLIGFVRSIDWALIDYATKLVVVHEINIAISAIREKHNLVPIDDGLPDQPDQPETPFRTIKAIVLTTSPQCEGAHRGEARPE